MPDSNSPLTSPETSTDGVGAHPDNWTIIPLSKKEFNQLPEYLYPTEITKQVKRKYKGRYLLGSWLKRVGTTDYIRWQHIWVTSL